MRKSKETDELTPTQCTNHLNRIKHTVVKKQKMLRGASLLFIFLHPTGLNSGPVCPTIRILMRLYYKNKQELIALIGDKISYINHQLFSDIKPDDSEIPAIRQAITFLKDHKYQLTSQGLNQLEFFIREAETAFQNLQG